MNTTGKETRKTIPYLLFILITLLLTTGLHAEDAKICLTMIVKNEGKIIERCLKSTKGVVDCICICDTGSTDDTVQIIENYMQKACIPGKVCRHEWKNFGHNRTLSVQASQKMLAEMGFPLTDTFLLLLDADMMLEVSPEFTKKSINADSYHFIQKNPWIVYYNTRLVRASLPWKCVGVTHEYWSSQIPCKEEKLLTLAIDDRDDGGSKSDKFERDIRLLTQGLQDEPGNVRYMFYLANSYKNLKKYDEAIKWYKERIAGGGWFEEVWYSKYMIGQIYQEMDQWDQALANYLDAYQYNPARAETIQEVSKYYRLKEQYNLSYFYAKQGSRIPYPQDQVLFIAYPVYDYLFDEDISISAYYTCHKDDGYAATNRLLLKKDVPQYIKDQAYRNTLCYVDGLKNAKFEPIVIDLPCIREGFPARYNLMNPSIQKTATGYNMICRTVNYVQIGAQHFKSLDVLDPTNTVRTRNFLVAYNKDIKLISQKEIVEDLPRLKHQARNVLGLEDCRIFGLNNSIWFTCTTLDTNPTGQPQISLCKLADDRSGDVINVEKLIPLIGPDPSRCEKNWLPFLQDNQLHVLYSYNPLIIYKPNIDVPFSMINNAVLTKRIASNHDLSRFSGSAAPIEFDDGYLVLVHETIHTDQRNYIHRFVYLDKDFNITKVSKPFIYFHKGIEYCCGMTIDHSGKNLLMPVGVEDREAFLCSVDLDTVRSLLEPI